MSAEGVPRQVRILERPPGTSGRKVWHLSAKDTLSTLEVKVLEVSKEGWWKATLKSGKTALLTAGERGRGVREIDIDFQARDGLRLRDPVPILGAYTKAFESKTAGVRFDHAPAQGVVAFADLFSSKILPDSEVVRVSIRRSSPEDDHGR